MNAQAESSTIHYRLWKNRKQAGLTQLQVAKILGLHSPSQVHRWEKGKRLPNLTQAIQLSCLYQRLVNDLFWAIHEQERDRIFQAKQALLENKKELATRN